MRWQIAQFIFCDQQQTLTDNDQIQQLEPMAVELLRYFCQHPDVIISKDELIENVWLGRIVSDNAVSKLVTKLRKAFADDSKKPSFIATFPKKGYKFIASATIVVDSKPEQRHQNEQQLSEQTSAAIDVGKRVEQTAETSNAFVTPDADYHLQSKEKVAISNTKSILNRWLMLMVVVVITAVFYWQNEVPDSEKTFVLTSAKAITTDAGNELFPDVSPDGTRVVYLSYYQKKIYLKIKRIADQKVITVDHGEALGVGPASWRDDGKQIAYLVANSEQCQYFIRDIDGMTLGEPQLIHNCVAGSFGKIIYTHHDNVLVYAENIGENSPYTLYQIDIQTGDKKRLTQPEIFLGGNSQFDLHPTENKLLISSPDKQQWEGFYQLDLKQDKLALLFKLNAYVCCAVWSHDGEHVVMMGEHPAYDLIQYDLAGGEKTILYTGTRIVRSPKRHRNGKDYFFSAGDKNTDIAVLQLNNHQQTTLIDSSVNEQLATFAHATAKIAYISLATGNEEIWLANSDGSDRHKLTSFADDRHYVDLKWSPKDNLLVALTLNEIHVISTLDGSYTKLKIPQDEIKGLSFKDDHTLAYSVKLNDTWRVHYYDIASEQVSLADSRWQFIQFANAASDTLWLDQQGKLFVGQAANSEVDHADIIKHFINERQFNLKKRGHLWFWYQWDKEALMQFNEQGGETNELIQTPSSYFDASEGRILFTLFQQLDIDIYQVFAIK